MTRTGVCVLHDMEWRWTIAGELADGVVVVSWMPHPARPDYDRPFYGLARFVDEHPVDALCQCEHTNVPSAQGCPKARAELDRRRAVAWAERCAATPAPIEHGYLLHCGIVWSVRVGGANSPLEFLDPTKPRTAEDHLRAEWAALWCEINGRASWDANPWVWVVRFERVTGAT